MARMYEAPTENAVQTTLDGQVSQGATSITLADASGLGDSGVICVDRIDVGTEEATPTKREYISYTGKSTNTLTGCSRGLGGSTDQVHNDGALVESVPDVVWAKSVYDSFNTEHDASDGTHSDIHADSIELGGSGATVSNILDEDDFASNSATALATQQSIAQAIQTGSIVYAADGEASDTYAITLTPAPSAYTTGMVIHFKANTANTDAATLNVNSLGAKTIKKLHDQDLSTGDIEAGQIVTVVYDGTNFQMQSQAATSASGSFSSYTPAWTSTGTAPAIGNGTIVGSYTQIGKLVIATVEVAFGSTSTYGTGSYRFSMPVASAQSNDSVVGTSILLDNGTAYHEGNARQVSTTTAELVVGSGQVNPTAPFTFTNGDKLSITFTYKAS